MDVFLFYLHSGSDRCFVFSLHPLMEAYTATGYNTNYVYLNQGQETLPNGVVRLISTHYYEYSLCCRVLPQSWWNILVHIVHVYGQNIFCECGINIIKNKTKTVKVNILKVKIILFVGY